MQSIMGSKNPVALGLRWICLVLFVLGTCGLSAPVLADNGELKINAALEASVFNTVEWNDTTLKEAMRDVAKKAGINIVIDSKNVDAEQKLTLSLANMTCANLLGVVADVLKLRRYVSDNVLWITTKEEAIKNIRTVTRTYDVRDITMEIRNFRGPRIENGRLKDDQPDDEKEPITIDEVIELIEKNVESEVWGQAGYSISPFGGQLVISASSDIHRKVRRFLNQLR